MNQTKETEKRRFSLHNLNDLLFWMIQLLVVGISMALIFSRLEKTKALLVDLLAAQNKETEIAKQQAKLNEEDSITARTHYTNAEKRMEDLVVQVNQVAADVKEALAKANSINDTILAATQSTKEAANTAAANSEKAANKPNSVTTIHTKHVVVKLKRVAVKPKPLLERIFNP